ncbi:Uncharacterized protein HZ326_20373 [Fusarium oxysporum f. sp. albedinis]|nr:Uncharacterized protein HZ326_20373 [Fusarium oxysporum f. sp. albedinis]
MSHHNLQPITSDQCQGCPTPGFPQYLPRCTDNRLSWLRGLQQLASPSIPLSSILVAQSPMLAIQSLTTRYVYT